MKRLVNISNFIKRTIFAIATSTLLTLVAMPTQTVYAATTDEMGGIYDCSDCLGWEWEGGGTDAVSRAQRWVGRAEYVWAACEPGQFDACGFVSYCVTGCYRRMGTTYTFLSWPQTSNPQPGDVCVSRGHCGIYAGNGMMIHAACEGQGVRIDPVHEDMIFVRSPY